MGAKNMKKFLLAIGTALAMIGVPASSFAQLSVGVSITVPPPPLPVYEQPPVPDQNYIWTPGYWAYGDDGYFWVPGTWVLAPQVGFLWTPAYWGFDDGIYVFHAGYWGPHIGFYGGINYGYGYGGSGYQGGRWDHGQFAYNRTVNNITNTSIIRNVYSERVVNNTTNRVSFNGGRGGVLARPSAAERQFAAGPHVPPTSMQMQHQQQAGADRNQFASVNHGAPPVAATMRPGAMTGPGVVHARAIGTQGTQHGAQNQAAHPQAMPGQPHEQAPQRQPGTPSPYAPTPQHSQAMVHQPMPQHQPMQQHQPAPQHFQEPVHQAVPQQQHQAAPRPAPQHPAESQGGGGHGDDKKPH